MRLLCQVVVRNEAHRYWQSWLEWHVPIFGAENIHVYDDASTDTTPKLAAQAGCAVTVGEMAMFAHHEGTCRMTAWFAMEDALTPARDDWVFCIDADEFLVATDDEATTVFRECHSADSVDTTVLEVEIPEVFHVEADHDHLVRPQVRVDGWWGRVVGTRLFRYQPGGVFADKAAASGSEPTYVTVPGRRRTRMKGAWLLHYGYAVDADRQAKYDRYRSINHGHADTHIASITAEPTLAVWNGPWFGVGRGHV